MKSLLTVGVFMTLSLAGCFGGSSTALCEDIEADLVIEMGGPRDIFTPDDATVSLGEDGEATVAWCNLGGSHNLQFEDGSINTEISPKKGLHHTETFTETGSFDYWCVPHKGSGMVGELTVEA